MNLNEWFDKGITAEEYTADLDRLKEGFERIYGQFNPPNEDQDTFKGVRVIVLAEVWCGHCMLNIPLLLRLTETTNIPVKFLPRDSHLELMDQYLTDDKRFIPIFIFIDEDGNEIGKWGPMAPEVKAYVDELKKDVPAKDAPNYEEKFREMITLTSKRFTEDEALWQTVYTNIKETLLNSVNN